MSRPVGWRVPSGGGVAHFFEVDPADPRRPWTLCGKVRRRTSYLHPFAGAVSDWRPCRDCWKRQPELRDVEALT